MKDKPTIGRLSGRMWVTRRNVEVDRMASAWLISRFIDRKARFKFVKTPYRPRKNEIRFDMFEAEFTHQGDHCTFEVLSKAADLRDAGVRAIGEIVHDIDLKDSRFNRPETAGVAALLRGIAESQSSDQQRIERSAAFFDDLYTTLRSRPTKSKSKKQKPLTAKRQTPTANR